MRRIGWLAVMAGLMLLPGIALAANSSARSAAEKQCRTERQSMAATFKSTYGTNKNGSNAFGKCVSHRTAQNSSDQSSAQTSAEKQCREQRKNDPSGFASQGGSKRNAFGKCVSTTARAKSQKDESTQVSDEDNAAKQCRAEQKSGSAAFKDKYGTNANKSNAFGKCVSQKARMMEQQQSAT